MFDIHTYATESVKLYLQCDQTFYKGARSAMKSAKEREVGVLATLHDVIQELQDLVQYSTPTYRLTDRKEFVSLVHEVGTRWINWDVVAEELHLIWSEDL